MRLTFIVLQKKKKALLPDKMQRLFQLMKEQNWLVEYRSIKGLERILFHMSKRTSFLRIFLLQLRL